MIYKRMSVNTTEMVVCNVCGDMASNNTRFCWWRLTSNNTRFCLTSSHLPPEKLGKTRCVCYKPDGKTHYDIKCNLLVVGYLCAIYLLILCIILYLHVFTDNPCPYIMSERYNYIFRYLLFGFCTIVLMT